MPELPEVETIKNQLAQFLPAKNILGLKIYSEKMTKPLRPQQANKIVQGAQIQKVERHGKYLLLVLNNDYVITIHLRLTGQVHYVESNLQKEKHTVAQIIFTDQTQVRFDDLRKFGTLQVMSKTDLADYLDKRTGVDCLDPAFTEAYFWDKVQKTKKPLKVFLLEQHHFTGIGNIYADEALHKAKLSPLMVTNKLTKQASDRLYKAVLEKLKLGIELGGASVKDYKQATGAEGKMQTILKAYGQRGKPCDYCQQPLTYCKVAGRGTVYCEHCQTET